MFEKDLDLQLRPNERCIFSHTPDFQLRASLDRDNPEQIDTRSVTVRGTRSERKCKPQKEQRKPLGTDGRGEKKICTTT